MIPFYRYLNVRSATSPSFSQDSQTLCFVSDITGVPQLWQVPVQGGWPEQLSFSDDRVTAGHYGHHTPFIVYGMDSGGNEREQLYLLYGSETTELAVDPAIMHLFGAISWDDRQIAYSDNRRKPAFFDVYVRNLDGGDERRVYEQDGSNFVSDWSCDGRYVLITRQTGALDAEVYLLDLKTGKARHLTPHRGLAQYGSAQFSPDGQSIYLRTDQDSEFVRGARMDLNGQLEFLTEDGADVDGIALSPDGSCLALIRNIDGYSLLTVRSLADGSEVRVPDLPDGVATQPVWSPDGSMLAFTFTGPADNPNIWIWDLTQHVCYQVTRASRGGLPHDSFVTPEPVSYCSFDDLLIPAFLYIPHVAGRPPVVMIVHGGPEGQTTPIFSPIVQYYVNRGYAVFMPNVRGSIGYGRTYTHLDDVEKRMDSVADLAAGARWLRESTRVDGTKIAIQGGSYGGFMVLGALTAYPDLWTAGVDIVGIANFETFLRNTGAYRRHWRIPEYGHPDEHAKLFRRISPIHHVDRIEAPLMVIHGDNDPRVPLSEAEQIVQALEQRGRPVKFLHFTDEGHGIIRLKNKLIAYPAIAEFLDCYLR